MFLARVLRVGGRGAWKREGCGKGVRGQVLEAPGPSLRKFDVGRAQRWGAHRE